MMNQKLITTLRQHYMKNPPEGISPKEIKRMSDSELLDMDYFLHEGNEYCDLDDGPIEGFYVF